MSHEMRWFTDWLDQDPEVTDEDHRRATAAYLEHVRSILPALPADLGRLALEPGLHLHDAQFRRVAVDPDRRIIELTVDTGYLDVGYRRLWMRVENATLSPEDFPRLEFAVTARYRRQGYEHVTEILDQEVDILADGRFVLRLRLYPFHDFAVEFEGFTLQETPLAERGPNEPAAFVDLRPDTEDWPPSV